MDDFLLTSGATLAIVLLMFWTAFDVGRARKRYDVAAPATTGDSRFERAFRIQANTLEWSVMTLPCLWLSAAFVGDSFAATLGATWIAARVWYALAYRRAPERRGPGFLIAALAFGALGLSAGAGLLLRLFVA